MHFWLQYLLFAQLKLEKIILHNFSEPVFFKFSKNTYNFAIFTMLQSMLSIEGQTLWTNYTNMSFALRLLRGGPLIQLMELFIYEHWLQKMLNNTMSNLCSL